MAQFHFLSYRTAVLIDTVIQQSSLTPDVNSQQAASTEADNHDLPGKHLGVQTGATPFISKLLRSSDCS
jgi:hypothetical protein